MNRLHSGGPLAVSAAAGGGEAHPGGAGRAGRGVRRPLGLPPQVKHPPPHPTTCLGAPAPSKVLLQPRAPEPPPRTSPRTSAAAEPAEPSARARSRECGFRSAARPALLVPHTRGTWHRPLAPLPSPQTWGEEERGNPRHHPPPARSPFMPGPRCSTAPDTCRSHRRPGLSELLISPGAVRRRLRRSGRWSFRGLGQETPAAVAAEDTPKRNAAHSPAPARSRRPDLSRREVSGFSRKRTRAHRQTARSTQRGHNPPGRCRPPRSWRPWLSGQSRGISQRPRGPLISKSREEWLTTRLPYPSLIAASPSAWNSAWHLATH